MIKIDDLDNNTNDWKNCLNNKNKQTKADVMSKAKTVKPQRWVSKARRIKAWLKSRTLIYYLRKKISKLIMRVQGKFRWDFEIALGKDPEYKFSRLIYNVISATDQINCPVFQKAKVKYEI